MLVLGEEIGWRGFALPRLMDRFGPWRASVIVAVLWAAWHMPLFYMPSMPQYGFAFLPYVVYLTGLSVILTFLAQKTKGSVLIATLFHGAVNTFGIVNPGVSQLEWEWKNALSYGLVAAVLGGVAWRRASKHVVPRAR